MAKKKLLEMEYGVEYEWKYEVRQADSVDYVLFTRDNAPKLFEELDIIEERMENGDISDEEYEAYFAQFTDHDVYRVYALRQISEPRSINRYDGMIPYENNPAQQLGDDLVYWEDIVPEDWSWSFNGEEVKLNKIALSQLVFSIIKIKK